MATITEFMRVIWAMLRFTTLGFARIAASLPVLRDNEDCKTFKLFGKVTEAQGLLSKDLRDAKIIGRMHFVGPTDAFADPLVSTFDVYISIDQLFKGDQDMTSKLPADVLFMGPVRIAPHKPHGNARLGNPDEWQFEGNYDFSHAKGLLVGVIKPLWRGAERLTVSAAGTGMYQWLLGYIKLEGEAGLV